MKCVWFEDGGLPEHYHDTERGLLMLQKRQMPAYGNSMKEAV